MRHSCHRCHRCDLYARDGQRSRSEPFPKGVGSFPIVSYAQIERALQAELMLRLRAGAWPIIALPIPNGIWLPARSEGERALVARLIARMKANGMLLPGAPDLVLLWADGCALI